MVWGQALAAFFAQGSHGGMGAAARLSLLPPLMIGECRTLFHASPYGKGRCHEVTEGIRVNPQKGRHLLCTFCPYEMRSMSGKGRELCPIGAKREGKPRYSGAALRAHAVVSPLKFSASHSLLLFCGQKKSNETRLYASPYGKGRWCKAPEGIRRSVFDMANRESGETIPPSLPPVAQRGAGWWFYPLRKGVRIVGRCGVPLCKGTIERFAAKLF